MSSKKEKAKPQPDITEGQWWRAKALQKRPDQILDNLVKQLEDDQDGRYVAYREYERLFGSAIGPHGDTSLRDAVSDDLIQNELRNTVETLWAQLFKNKIVPAVSVVSGDWEEWDRARSYGRWLEGAMDEALVWEEALPRAGVNMLRHGTGIVRVGWEEVDEKTARVKVWSVNPRYFLVDRMEAKHGKPRSIFFKDHTDRWVLYDTYGEDREEFYGDVKDRLAGIFKATSNDDPDLGLSSTARCDMITVREAFHLPSGPRSKDGRHVIWIKGCTLVDREFSWDTLPAMFMRYGASDGEGFYGESAVRLLAPTQKQLDKLNKKLDECQDIMGVPRIILANGGQGIKTLHLDDIPGSILSVPGSVGDIRDWNAQCATPELYKDRDQAPQKMRNLLGISNFEATAQLPAGLRDVGAPFMERFVEQGQARHAMDHAEVENGVIRLAYLMMLQAEELQAMGYDVVVKGPVASEKSAIEELSFKDVHVDRKRLKLRVQAMSQLPQSFAGKVEAIGKLQSEANVAVDPKTVLRMLEVPDLAGETDLLVSDEEIIFKNLCYMTKTGEYLPPMPHDNLDLIVQMTTRWINRYRVRHDADGYVVGVLAQYIDDAIQLKNGLGGPNPSAPPPMSTAAALGMGGPPGGPPPPPGGPVPPMGGEPPPPPMFAPPPPEVPSGAPGPQGPAPGMMQ